jgi:hypothetical protein
LVVGTFAVVGLYMWSSKKGAHIEASSLEGL